MTTQQISKATKCQGSICFSGGRCPVSIENSTKIAGLQNRLETKTRNIRRILLIYFALHLARFNCFNASANIFDSEKISLTVFAHVSLIEIRSSTCPIYPDLSVLMF
jgi:hypothetical protein